MMNTVICNKCDNHIQVLGESQSTCIFCGNDIAANKTEDTFFSICVSECEKALLESKYSVAIELYDKYVERFPNSSQLYWGRMLARNHCKNDSELIIRGINVSEDPDFVLALHFSSSEEKTYYTKIETIRKSIASEIEKALEKNEKKQKLDTNIVQIQKETLSEIKSLQDKLAEKTKILDEVECRLRSKSIDSDVLINASKTTFNAYVGKLETLKGEIQQLKDVEFSRLCEYKELISRNSAVCQQEWSNLQNFKGTSYGKDFAAIVKEQSQAEQEVSGVHREIEAVIKKMNDVIASTSLIANRHNEAREEIKQGSYSKSKLLLGEETILSIVKKSINI